MMPAPFCRTAFFAGLLCVAHVAHALLPACAQPGTFAYDNGFSSSGLLAGTTFNLQYAFSTGQSGATLNVVLCAKCVARHGRWEEVYASPCLRHQTGRRPRGCTQHAHVHGRAELGGVGTAADADTSDGTITRSLTLLPPTRQHHDRGVTTAIPVTGR